MKETAKLYIVNPSLEDIIRSSNNLKSQAFIAEMDVSNFRKSMTLSGGQQLRTFLKIAQAAKKDVIFLLIDADVVEPITGPLSLQNDVHYTLTQEQFFKVLDSIYGSERQSILNALVREVVNYMMGSNLDLSKFISQAENYLKCLKAGLQDESYGLQSDAIGNTSRDSVS